MSIAYRSPSIVQGKQMTDQPPTNPVPVLAARHPHLFVVRVWWEPDNGGASGEWRGAIEHVGSRAKQYFREMEALAAFIEGRLSPAISQEDGR